MTSLTKVKNIDGNDPSYWSEKEICAHLKSIGMKKFAGFCKANQINGDLLKDICFDEDIMTSIICGEDSAEKITDIKKYFVEKWRPRKILKQYTI